MFCFFCAIKPKSFVFHKIVSPTKQTPCACAVTGNRQICFEFLFCQDKILSCLMRSFCAFVLFIHSMLPSRHSSMFILSKKRGGFVVYSSCPASEMPKERFFHRVTFAQISPVFSKNMSKKGKAIIFICLYSETIVICQKASYRLLV